MIAKFRYYQANPNKRNKTTCEVTRKTIAASGLRRARCLRVVFSKVLAARKTNLIIAYS